MPKGNAGILSSLIKIYFRMKFSKSLRELERKTTTNHKCGFIKNLDMKSQNKTACGLLSHNLKG